MELFSAEFFAALAAIIVIDLVLAGDNAIVIALAARNVPAHMRQRAILWGTVGAIVVRTAMTLVIVWLLKIPGLLAAGGLALIWIAVKLLKQEESNGLEVNASNTFGGAIKTIVIADAMMGLDNVLAVAGAAHGSFLLVVLGLLISIPIIIWGSKLILHWVDRYPAIIYVGSGVLAWTAASMTLSEPLFQEGLETYPWIRGLTYAVVMISVLLGGFLRNHRPVRARVALHIADAGRAGIAEAARLRDGLTKVLIPVDGSPNALRAVHHVASQFAAGVPLEVHLLTVSVPLPQRIARFFSRKDLGEFHLAQAGKALGGARMILDRAGVPYAYHVETGPKVETIRASAERLGASYIVIGTARKNSLTRLIQDSVTSNLMKITTVPIEVIVGSEVSPIERFALPAGVGAALAWLLVIAFAVD